MTDVIIYKKIEVTIIRPSEEYIWIENEKHALIWHKVFGFSPKQVLLYSVKGGVGVSATLFQTAIYQFCVTAPERWKRQVAKRASRAPGDVASVLAFSTHPQQQLILSVIKAGFK
jgi:hypothetical protein